MSRKHDESNNFVNNPQNQLAKVIKFSYAMANLDGDALSKDSSFLIEWAWFNSKLNRVVEPFYT